MIPVENSTRVLAIGYNKQTAIVYVQFKDYSYYQYNNVPEDVWFDFLHSSSKGKFINSTLNDFDYHSSSLPS
jgi:hypothetical protein